MTKVIILYAPQDSGMKKFVEALQKAFDKKKYVVTTKSATKSQIPDIAATEAVIFGSKGNSAVSLHADFKEFVRAFHGINLAGKVAGFIIEKNTETYTDFVQALQASDISVFDEPLLYQEKPQDAKQLKRWVARYSAFVKRNLHE